MFRNISPFCINLILFCLTANIITVYNDKIRKSDGKDKFNYRNIKLYKIEKVCGGLIHF